MWRMIGSPGFPRHEERTRELAGEAFDRGVSASGALRQMMAILTQPNRSPALRRLRMPTLVVHGLADRMVHVSGGRATAAAIPGAELLLDRRDGPRPAARALRDARRRDHAHGRRGPEHARAGRGPRSAAGSGVSQSERRSPVSVSNTWTFFGSVVTWIVSPFLTESRALLTRTITLPGVPSTSQVP